MNYTPIIMQECLAGVFLLLFTIALVEFIRWAFGKRD
jgi:hypothetical protein